MWLLILSLLLLGAVKFYEYSHRVRPTSGKSAAWPSSSASYDEPKNLKYRRAALMTPAELRFFESLEIYVGLRARVLSKVRIADLATPQASPYSSTWQSAFNRIALKHVDFVLVDNSFTPLAVVELDDSSHAQYARIKRDDFVDSVFNDIGLPIVHVLNRAVYTSIDFKALDRVLEKR